MSDDLAKQMMTLSAIAYSAEKGAIADIKKAMLAGLAASGNATAGDWKLVWGPMLVDETLMYCVRSSTEPHRFVLVIRGTDFVDIVNWVQDFWIGLTPFVTPAQVPSGLTPLVSKGTALGMQQLVDMYVGEHPQLFHLIETPARSLRSFIGLEAVRLGQLDFTVTGHSMGGTLASALGVWLIDHFSVEGLKATVQTVTFAAPTAGNVDFADYANLRLGSSCPRYYNVRDIMPLAWNDVDQMHTTPTALGGLDSWAIPVLDLLVRELRGKGFSHPGAGLPLTGDAVDGGWFHLVGQEHAAATYLKLLGAPLLQ